jgi:NhaA family Na+:H+ antiporter
MSKTPKSTSRSLPFLDFVYSESFSGLLLITASVVAFAWANSPTAAADYAALLAMPIKLGVGAWALEKTLLHTVNDLLMSIFFLMVGLEIKRELIAGELSNPKARALPVAAAIGGMVVPALFYALFNLGGDGERGWGIPMATDIAFALGVLSLLGARVPLGLKVFLTALAIVDDLGAVLVIALFYTSQVDWNALAISLGLCALAGIYGWRNGQRVSIYLLFGLLAWYFMLKSGVHATVAGVLIALTVPNNRVLSAEGFRRKLQGLLGRDSRLGDDEDDFHEIRKLVVISESPLHELETKLHPWVAYLIVPLFAFLNAGFALGSLQLMAPISLGAFVGLLLGKPLGICGASWLVVKKGWAELPEGADWRALIGIGLLGGIGFTMSLFVSALAFGEGNLDAQAKLGVFAASLVAAIAGLLMLRQVLPKPKT